MGLLGISRAVHDNCGSMLERYDVGWYDIIYCVRMVHESAGMEARMRLFIVEIQTAAQLHPTWEGCRTWESMLHSTIGAKAPC